MKNILILDDDTSFIELMKGAFDASKYTVTSASNGEEGLEVRDNLKPDIILLDINMPKMDGIEFLKRLNAKYGEGSTPIIITSNISSMDKISEGVSLGVKGYIVKSNESVQGIISTVERTLGVA